MKYNYIYFNTPDDVRRRNPNGYYTICVRDLEKMDGIHVVPHLLENTPYVMRILFSAHRTQRINRFINLPFKEIWYPWYFRNSFADDKPICFVVAIAELPITYLQYLRKHYPGCKIVKIHRDLIHTWKCYTGLSHEEINSLFDLRMTYDEEEAKKYGFPYFSEFESKIEVPKDPCYPLSDVFFAGLAKDRFSRLLKIYDILTSANLKVNYYLTGVPREQQISRPGIKYADKQMSYREMLYKTVNSRCVLEINQGGAVGYTSRFLEAVIYGKKLITDNTSIKKNKFYNPKYIQILDNMEDIDIDFIKDVPENVDYHYAGEFSPVHLIEQIEKILCQQDREQGHEE